MTGTARNASSFQVFSPSLDIEDGGYWLLLTCSTFDEGPPLFGVDLRLKPDFLDTLSGTETVLLSAAPQLFPSYVQKASMNILPLLVDSRSNSQAHAWLYRQSLMLSASF